MTTSQNLGKGLQSGEDLEASLLATLNFITTSWRKLVCASILGLVIGLFGWFILGNYDAELVLLNNGGTNLVGWRSLQKTLPNLAAQIVDESKEPDGQKSLYQSLSESSWWQRNAIPTYAVTRSDAKELASISGLESAGASIVSLTIFTGGSSKNKAIGNALLAKDFLLQGGSYLAIKSMLSAQESQLINGDAEIQKKINAAQIELGYQQQRLRSLEGLAKRFPSEQKTIGQVIDPKDSGAKYLPISTQIIATNTDIHNINESLERLRDHQAQLTILQRWVKIASPLVASTYDGITLNRLLLEQEAKLRATLDHANPKMMSFVDDLRSSLLANDVRFTKGFEMNTSPLAKKKGMIKSAVGGLVIGLLLMILSLLFQKAWKIIQVKVIK